MEHIDFFLLLLFNYYSNSKKKKQGEVHLLLKSYTELSENLKVKNNNGECSQEVIEFMIPRKRLKRAFVNKIAYEKILTEKGAQECQILRKKVLTSEMRHISM